MLTPARRAISAREARPYPDSAMASIAHARIWARRAVSVKVGESPDASFDRMVKI